MRKVGAPKSALTYDSGPSNSWGLLGLRSFSALSMLCRSALCRFHFCFPLHRVLLREPLCRCLFQFSVLFNVLWGSRFSICDLLYELGSSLPGRFLWRRLPQHRLCSAAGRPRHIGLRSFATVQFAAVRRRRLRLFATSCSATFIFAASSRSIAIRAGPSGSREARSRPPTKAPSARRRPVSSTVALLCDSLASDRIRQS